MISQFIRLLILSFIGLSACRPIHQETVRFNNGSIRLEGTLYMPSGRGPFPAVVLVHGSGPDGRHNSTFDYHATILARQGIAALAYDKRGVGGSTGDWRYVSLSDLAGDVIAAVGMLSTRADIDARRIGLWGGSQGGWVAPLAASQSEQVAFVITVAGSLWSPARLAKWRSLSRVREAGYGADVEATVNRLMDLQAEQIREQGWEQGWSAYLQEARRYQGEAWYASMSRLRNPLDDTSWYMPYTSDIDFDVRPILEGLTIPVIAFLGEADELVPAQEMAAVLDSIKGAAKADIAYVVVPGASHNMTPAGSLQPVRGYTRTLLQWTRDQTARVR